MKNKTKALDREEVYEFNRNLSKMLNDIEYQLYDLGADHYSLKNTQHDSVSDKVKDLAKAMRALKVELYEMSEPRTDKEAC
jgi:hypothetical protein